MEAEIENLFQWADSKGITLNGIAPKQLHGRGVGIVATEHIKVNLTTSPKHHHLSRPQANSYSGKARHS